MMRPMLGLLLGFSIWILLAVGYRYVCEQPEDKIHKITPLECVEDYKICIDINAELISCDSLLNICMSIAQ